MNDQIKTSGSRFLPLLSSFLFDLSSRFYPSRTAFKYPSTAGRISDSS